MTHRQHKRDQAKKQAKKIADWKARGITALPEWAYKRTGKKPKRKD
jgi:hypothetical protein